MTSQADVMAVLTSEWQTTAEIARRLPNTCLDFDTHRSAVFNILQIMYRRGDIRKTRNPGISSFWRLPE